MERLLSVIQVIDRLGCSRVTLWRMLKNNQFPKPMFLGRVRRWPESKIDQWILENDGANLKIQ